MKKIEAIIPNNSGTTIGQLNDMLKKMPDFFESLEDSRRLAEKYSVPFWRLAQICFECKVYTAQNEG